MPDELIEPEGWSRLNRIPNLRLRVVPYSIKYSIACRNQTAVIRAGVLVLGTRTRVQLEYQFWCTHTRNL